MRPVSKNTATLALLAPLLALADGTPPDVEITVKPRLCIVDKRTPACESTFTVAWRSRETGYYCVFNELEPDALHCWPQQSAGRLDDERRVSEAFSYTLNEGEDGPAVATAVVEVLEKGSDDRRRRRRTRHVWDIL